MNIIENKELSIYKEHTLIVWGCGNVGSQTSLTARKLNIPIHAFCDIDPTKWGTKFCGCPIISPEELKKLHKTTVLQGEKPLLVEIVLVGNNRANILEFLSTLEYQEQLFVTRKNFLTVDYFLDIISEQYPQYENEVLEIHSLRARIGQRYDNTIRLPNPEIYEHIIVCQLAKTGDNAITKTYSKHTGTEIAHTHEPERIAPQQGKELRLPQGYETPLAVIYLLCTKALPQGIYSLTSI